MDGGCQSGTLFIVPIYSRSLVNEICNIEYLFRVPG